MKIALPKWDALEDEVATRCSRYEVHGLLSAVCNLRAASKLLFFHLACFMYEL